MRTKRQGISFVLLLLLVSQIEEVHGSIKYAIAWMRTNHQKEARLNAELATEIRKNSKDSNVGLYAVLIGNVYETLNLKLLVFIVAVPAQTENEK
jgi:hypothetical protein